MTDNRIKVAVTQLEPEWLDLPKSVEKVCKYAAEAAAQGAKLVTFPEVFIPGYPIWIWNRVIDPPTSVSYIKNSMKADGPEMQKIRDCAAEHSIAISLGFSENHNSSLYISQALVDNTGKLLHHRRKIKPTHMERTVFGEASGSSLNNVWPLSEKGPRVGQLACWEHIQPLLKFHTFHQVEDIHVSAWPPVFPHTDDSPIFYSMSREGCRTLSQTYAIEGQSFVLHTTAVLSQSGIDQLNTSTCHPGLFGAAGGGSSAIFAPDGRKISRDIAETEEGIIYADLDLDLILQNKTFADACGQYSRPDLLWLQADTRDKMVVELPKINGEAVR